MDNPINSGIINHISNMEIYFIISHIINAKVNYILRGLSQKDGLQKG